MSQNGIPYGSVLETDDADSSMLGMNLYVPMGTPVVIGGARNGRKLIVVHVQGDEASLRAAIAAEAHPQNVAWNILKAQVRAFLAKDALDGNARPIWLELGEDDQGNWIRRITSRER